MNLNINQAEEDLKVANNFSPILNFCEDEPYFPIGINSYLQQCNLITPTTLIQNPRPETFFLIYQNLNAPTKRNDAYYLKYKNEEWRIKLKGDISTKGVPTYAHIQNKPDMIEITYIFLFACTIPYKLCTFCGLFNSCCCSYNKGAHLGDVKHIRVIVNRSDMSINKVYFGAHGDNAGEWKNKEDITLDGTHPCVYSCKGDHSFYYNRGHHPRICGAVDDYTEESIILHTIPKIIYDKDNSNFNPYKDGWIYNVGKMNVDGINSPVFQTWFTEESKNSNNGCKRFFCCNYW